MGQFHVSDMTCGHCEKVITEALKKASAEAEVKVDLSTKTVDVENLQDGTVVQVLKDLGYTPEKME